VPDGARLGGPPGPRRLVGLVDGGNGHSGKRSPEVHFGLGSQPPGEPLKVELRWRDSEGRAWRETRWLKPGWHTVVLGRGSQEG
jgi:hypothetical protein